MHSTSSLVHDPLRERALPLIDAASGSIGVMDFAGDCVSATSACQCTDAQGSTIFPIRCAR